MIWLFLEDDLPLELKLHELFIWETIDEKDVLLVSEYDKEKYNFLSEFILQDVFATGTVDKAHLLAISKKDAYFLQMYNFEPHLNLLSNI